MGLRFDNFTYAVVRANVTTRSIEDHEFSDSILFSDRLVPSNLLDFHWV
jgi:hypothetical protein